MKKVLFSLILIAASLAIFAVSNAAQKVVSVGKIPSKIIPINPNAICISSLNLTDDQQKALQWLTSSATPPTQLYPSWPELLFSDPYCCAKPLESQERLDCLNGNWNVLFGYKIELNNAFDRLSKLHGTKCGTSGATPTECSISWSSQTTSEQIEGMVNSLKCDSTYTWTVSTTMDALIKDLQNDCH